MSYNKNMKKCFTLAEGATHVAMQHNNRKLAFTLAEVLVTLAVIGIVAAMTIPNLVQNYQKKETVVRLKKAYSTLRQAIEMSQTENGYVTTWDMNLDAHEFFLRYFKPYLKTDKEYTSSELQAIAPHTVLNGNAYNGTTYSYITSSHFTLADGSIITINLNNIYEGGIWIGIDVNGIGKPNRIGKDTFLFFLSHKNGLVAFGDGEPRGSDWDYQTLNTTGENTRDFIMTSSSRYACKKNGYGYWCTALIMMDGWEIKDDYPW